MDLQITNLNLGLIDADIQRLFTPFGEINSVKIIIDKLNNRSRGRAIIEMPIEQEALKAIVCLHGSIFASKVISVTELTRNNEERSSNSIPLN